MTQNYNLILLLLLFSFHDNNPLFQIILIGREGVEPSVSYSPTAYKAVALTAELPPHNYMVWYSYSLIHSVTPFLKPVTNHDSAPPAWKAGMLPITPHGQIRNHIHESNTHTMQYRLTRASNLV